MDETLEKLRHFKEVSIQITDTIKSGQEEVIIPDVLYKSFVDSQDNSDVSGSTDSGIFPEAGKTNVPQISCPFIKDEDGYWVEYSKEDKIREAEEPKEGTRFTIAPSAANIYRAHFFNQDHWNFYLDETDVGPCVLSIKTDVENKREAFRILIRSPQQFLHGVIPAANLAADRHNLDDVVSALTKEMGFTVPFKKAPDQGVDEKILRIDETFAGCCLKVGVVHIKKGQTKEGEIFANLHEPSGYFDKFLQMIGDHIPLLGFDGYLGGLDNGSNLTGESSIYTEFANHEIMYHVSTLLPYTPKDPQQVSRKRHIGNDLVAVIFLEDEDSVFSPTLIQSHFLHSYIVVQLAKGSSLLTPKYRVACVSRNLVPWFGPSLAHHCVFSHGAVFRDYLRTKVINAVRATYQAPKFVRMTSRSRSQLLAELITGCDEDIMSNKRARGSKRFTRRGSWLPIGAHRPPSPLIDGSKQKYENHGKLARDFQRNLRCADLADVVFYVGQSMTPVYGVKAILACRSKVFRSMFFEAGLTSSKSPSSSSIRRNKTVCVQKPPTPLTPRRLSSTPTNAGSKRFAGLKLRKGSSFEATCPESINFKDKHISESYYVLEWSDAVFSEVVTYLMTGSCTIKASTIVGLGCAAEYYELEDLRQACQERLPDCLTVDSVCKILCEVELYYDYHTAKSMLMKVLHFTDENAQPILTSPEFLTLSERMVHVISERDLQMEEIEKVKAILAWGEKNFEDDDERRQRLTSVMKDVRLHLITANDLMKIVVPFDVVPTDTIMAALAFQLDPASVDLSSYRMSRTKKSPEKIIPDILPPTVEECS